MRRVAIVHPDRAARNLAARVLDSNGYPWIEAESAEEATSVFRANSIAIAVVDESLAGTLRSVPVPWIGVATRGARAPLVAAGAACAIEKPFSAEDLLRAVAWALRVYDDGISDL